MSKNRDDEPAYIFCDAETKKEMVKRYGADVPPDEVFVVADIIRYDKGRVPGLVIYQG